MSALKAVVLKTVFHFMHVKKKQKTSRSPHFKKIFSFILSFKSVLKLSKVLKHRKKLPVKNLHFHIPYCFRFAYFQVCKDLFGALPIPRNRNMKKLKS